MFTATFVLFASLLAAYSLRCHPSNDDGFFHNEFGSWRVANSVISCSGTLLAWPFYRLHSHRLLPSHRSLFVNVLLLMSGIESNPGPGTGRQSSLAFGSLNARSAVKKSALIRDLVESHNLDILAVCETWFNSDDPNAIKLDMAPPGYLTKNLNNTIPGRVGRCGGLALIHRDNLVVRPSVSH